MKSTLIPSILLAGLVLVSTGSNVEAQHTRNPGGGGGGSSSGGSGGGSGGGSSSGGSSSGGASTGTAVPRGGGTSPWGGGKVSSRPSEPTSSSSGVRGPSRVSGSRGGDGGSGSVNVPPGYTRSRNGAPVTGYGVPRATVATLPPIISGPIYWGPNDWYFYPWGYGALALGYFWDPWMWAGYYGGMGGYPWVDPYWSGGGGGGGGSFGSWDNANGTSESTSPSPAAENPLDADGPTGGVRLKVVPREAEVYVDGFFAGRVDDFDGAMQKLKIVQGSHRIELRAEGYETASFTVNVIADETTSYKTELKRR
jgi:hypothetical protein